MCATNEPVRSARPPRPGRRGRAGRGLPKARARHGERRTRCRLEAGGADTYAQRAIPGSEPNQDFAPSACIVTVAVGHCRWNEGCERHPHRGDILGDREHAVRTSPGQRACARRRWCSSLSGLVGWEVVEEGDHAGPELLGGQGVGLRGAAHAHVGEERVVRGPAEVVVSGAGVVQVGDRRVAR